MALDIGPGLGVTNHEMAAIGRRMLLAQQLPTWNKTILDRSIKRALEQADGTRPGDRPLGRAPHLPQLDGTDSHLYFGWYHGDERDLPRFAATMPRMVRFVTEFGAQAVPEDASFCEPERWPDLDWARLGHRHALQKRIFDRYVPPADFATFDEWRAATQRYQATVIKHHIETLRRLKYRPHGWLRAVLLRRRDARGDVGGARARPPAEARLRRAGRRVRARDRRGRPPAGTVHPGDALALDVHVVSDRHAWRCRAAR